MTRRQHFVVFLSPGTFVDEMTLRPIEAWDPPMAARMAKVVLERYDSIPYAFRFETHIVADPIGDGEGGKLNVAPKMVTKSGLYFIEGTALTFDDVVARHDKNDAILVSNMAANHMWIVCETNRRWKHMGAFEEDDAIVDESGRITVRGNDPSFVGYRNKMDEQKRREDAERIAKRGGA